jgi:hypothetical protein
LVKKLFIKRGKRVKTCRVTELYDTEDDARANLSLIQETYQVTSYSIYNHMGVWRFSYSYVTGNQPVCFAGIVFPADDPGEKS